ncbi:sensor histidine kinase [Streptomyces tagetis]|uniref:histidine kinase n=1 Tax=Streptomyces tagetis TaxID=2820809 RepID=A0A940XBQ1_9ACTN|nr:histidine kinase [Streptomyces sp. RG38]MBQ0825196.1 two-component sensor histidine kinase [Streptomyces sp. RG38]
MPRLLRPLTRAVTYTRWLHVLVGAVVPFACALVYPGLNDPSPGDWLLIAVLPVPLALAAAMVPPVRRAEGLQARLMLFAGPHARGGREQDPGVSTDSSTTWNDRVRTGAWLVLRLEAGLALALVTNALMSFTLALAGAGAEDPGLPLLPHMSDAGRLYVLLTPVPVLVLVLVAAGAGALVARAARRLLGPSVKERLAALEEHTERLLERDHIARELHDTLGHALTLAVVQAGAARTAGDPEFTDRALEAIEETGRDALEDLERVLLVLRETGRPAGTGPALDQAGRLLDSARAAGSRVDAELTGQLEDLPGPVTREAYRMLQEGLTNVLRHAGPVPIRVRVAVEGAWLRIDVRNPLPATTPPAGAGGGTGLRGVRERAALLGGEARTAQAGGEWLLLIDLPCADLG